MGFFDNVKNVFKKEEKINQYKNGEKEGKWVTIKEDNSIIEKNYENGNLKNYKEYDENTQANGTWTSYDIISGETERISVYSHGKLIKEKIKEPETTEIGFVEYIYFDDGYIIKQYIPQENEFVRIIKEKEGYEDVYWDKEIRRIVHYRRYNKQKEIVIIGEFDEELKQTGTWAYYDNSGELIKKEYFEKGKTIDEYSRENKWNGI